ncbi:hypothetical protein TNIN_208791 [Trichonephila inaurata madagascariensis]|uniref:Uncharacterized protein n=1 Tax=Trichonephila inaurata madagascariensis TaxID=2747483 RepID=A0A8X6Y8A9_9ARAC|nr:hypothetical protein TNIN_208791 [Trichonephila inaurata madagascariensis]
MASIIRMASCVTVKKTFGVIVLVRKYDRRLNDFDNSARCCDEWVCVRSGVTCAGRYKSCRFVNDVTVEERVKELMARVSV